jgi:hypothetical protein
MIHHATYLILSGLPKKEAEELSETCSNLP